MRPASHSPQVLERMSRAVDLRKLGRPYRAIALELGVSDAQARRDVQEALAQYHDSLMESAGELVQLEAHRLDGLLEVFYPLAVQGSVKALQSVLSLMDRRAKLFGLDRPTRVDARLVYKDLTDEELDEEAKRLGLNTGV